MHEELTLLDCFIDFGVGMMLIIGFFGIGLLIYKAIGGEE